MAVATTTAGRRLLDNNRVEPLAGFDASVRLSGSKKREREREENEPTRNGMASVSRKNHRDEEPALSCAQLERANIIVIVHLH
jgi:hypothetical protein